MRILLSEDSVVRRETCARVLSALPDWFGDQAAIEAYAKRAAELPTLIAADDAGEPVGFLCLDVPSTSCLEIHVMGVLAPYHGMGVGRSLVAGAERCARKQGARFLAVKTLSDRSVSRAYETTRRFYASMGFLPVMELPGLWDDRHPCLLMLKVLE